MRQIIPKLVMAVSALALAGCQANRPPPRRAEQARPVPAMTADQMDEVQAVLQRGSGTLNRRCYQQELDRRGESFEAKAVVKILVEASGRAGAVEFGESTMDAAFRDCIVRVIQTWEFPRLPEAASFTYPLSFSPEY